MMKIVTAFTEEADLADEAIAQLKAQIKPGENLLSHSLGIVHCHPDFFQGDTLKEIAGAFDFPLVGCASSGMSGTEELNGLGLSLTVLSSDEACFTAAHSGEITGENYDEEIARLYSALTGGQSEPPALILFYAPFRMDIPVERILVSLGETAKNIPVFGSVGVSAQEKLANSYPLCGGEALANGVVLAAVYTKEKLRFYSASIKHERIMRLNDQVTAVKGKVLISIGGKIYREYMEANGIGTGVNASYYFHNPDGSELVRVCMALTPDGYGIFAGEVPENAAIAVCAGVSREDIAETATELLSRAKGECGDISGCLIYSCMSRLMLLGVDKNTELKVVQENMENRVFNFAYSGGEVFPQTLKDGRIINQLQNNTLIVCVFHG
jgi:hypothetical protein